MMRIFICAITTAVLLSSVNAFAVRSRVQWRRPVSALQDDVVASIISSEGPFLNGQERGLFVAPNISYSADCTSCEGVEAYGRARTWFQETGAGKDWIFAVESVSSLDRPRGAIVAVQWKVQFTPAASRQLVAFARLLPVEIQMFEIPPAARSIQAPPSATRKAIFRALSSGVLKLPLAVLRGKTKFFFEESEAGRLDLVSQQQEVQTGFPLKNHLVARHLLEFYSALLPPSTWEKKDEILLQLEAASVDYSIDLGPISFLLVAIAILDVWLIRGGIYNPAMFYDYICYTVGC